ncbi:ATP-dependent 6-phosphofructokinase 5, chloroplastic-like [Humulus lupulus]|uniref:ATP-dependent 6-phosphofructokinase 5, chloroplastic-like n=1 Tax=Humulus lupulus TaxID=3486 RepID=UPI002B40212B|nr:ATP-dependent 6-phosphofructokinase 5, chloroplastic-like [Humulus lupulus]
MLLRKIGLGYELIHVCEHDGALFSKKHIGKSKCPVCGEDRDILPIIHAIRRDNKTYGAIVKRPPPESLTMRTQYGSEHMPRILRGIDTSCAKKYFDWKHDIKEYLQNNGLGNRYCGCTDTQWKKAIEFFQRPYVMPISTSLPSNARQEGSATITLSHRKAVPPPSSREVVTLRQLELTRKVVQNVHLSGGSLLGVSRGGPGISEIVDSMEERGINMLFVLGGNGTHAGANVIHKECCRRGVKVAVVGVPKTIDNDILLMDKTFGFDTAVEEAQLAINSAYIEAHSAYHGIGIVKLMGRSSGFIAMHASLASGQIDISLIPEAPFHLHGPHGVLRHLKYLIETKGSAVVCVAEGAGQKL